MATEIEQARDYAMRVGAADFARWGQALMIAKGDHMMAGAIFGKRNPKSRNLELIKKAAVAAGSTTDSPLVHLEQLSKEFAALVRGLTVLGRLPGVRRVPFNVKVPRVTAGSSAGFTGQGRVTRAGSLAFDSIELKQSKISGIVVVSGELARLSDPAAEQVVHQDLIGAVTQATDEAFLNPTLAAIDDVSPASITYGAPSVESTGATIAAVTLDLQNLFAAASQSMVSPCLIMKPSTAGFLCRLSSGSGMSFPDLRVNGGFIWGVPVIVSANVPADADSPSNSMIILIDSADVLLADGDIELDVSEHALVQLDGSPDSPPTASTTMSSLWALNMLGLKATRYINWQRRRDDSVAVLNGVAY